MGLFSKKITTATDMHIVVANFCKELDAVISAAMSRHVGRDVIAGNLGKRAKALRRFAAVSYEPTRIHNRNLP
jgi:hypothetical protein